MTSIRPWKPRNRPSVTTNDGMPDPRHEEADERADHDAGQQGDDERDDPVPVLVVEQHG